jgi:hypothetical protein
MDIAHIEYTTTPQNIQEKTTSTSCHHGQPTTEAARQPDRDQQEGAGLTLHEGVEIAQNSPTEDLWKNLLHRLPRSLQRF